jgi:hypothetical protein
VPTPPFPPGLLARYEILGPLGEGGMGVVYRGRQITLDREVAIKLLKSGGAEDEQRFVREGRLLAQLACPQIVRVMDADADRGRLWLVCELVAGETLQQRHRRAPLPLIEALEVVAEVARALEYAHARGIVHRDVKPDNVILTEHGTVKLADFGLARELVGSEDLTSEGLLMGTPHFISPEQVRGKRATPESDQYALGVMLYWLATGVYPVDGESAMAVMMCKATTVPRPAHAVNETLPRQLSAIAARALALDPDERFESVTALAAALEPLRVELAPRSPERPLRPPRVQPPLTTLRTPASSPPPRGPVAGMGVAGAALALVGALAWFAGPARPPPPPPPAEAFEAPEILFRRVDGADVLEVRSPAFRGLALELVEGPDARRLVPALPTAEACRFRVDPERIVGPVTLRITAVEGTPFTTDVRWPGLITQLDHLESLIAGAHKMLQSETLRELAPEARRRAVRRLRDEWSRRVPPLAELAPALLDVPSLRLETKRSIHDALTPLRVLDRYAALEKLEPVLPRGVLGRTFAAGVDEELVGPAALAVQRPLAITPRLGDGQGDVVLDVLSMANATARTRTMALEAPAPPPGARAVLELATGSLAPRDVVWVQLGEWKLLVTPDAHARRPRGERGRENAFLSLDARLVTAGSKMSLSHEALPGPGGHSELRTLGRFWVHYVPR